jgi:hypothetical protein
MPSPRHVIPLAELRACRNAYLEHSDWDAMLDFFRQQPTDWATIQLLVQELQANRFFREPIRLGEADDDDDNQTRWVWDGTHRTCAYILAGVDEVEIILADEETEEDDWEPSTVDVDTTIKLRTGGAFPDEDYAEHLWMAIMSLRIDDAHWIVSDLNFVTHHDGDLLTAAWSSEARDIPTSQINERVATQLAQAGFNVQALDIRTQANPIL